MQSMVHNKMSQFAYQQVKKLSSDQKEFRSLARSFPSMLQMNGLGAAIAFLYSKKEGKNAHASLYACIEEWAGTECMKRIPNFDSKDDLMNCIVKLDSNMYRLFTNEIMHLCLWIKRFAEGMLDSEQEVGDSNAK